MMPRGCSTASFSRESCRCTFGPQVRAEAETSKTPSLVLYWDTLISPRAATYNRTTRAQRRTFPVYFTRERPGRILPPPPFTLAKTSQPPDEPRLSAPHSYDGGDCCSCTCSGSSGCDLEGRYLNCIDPAAACFGEDVDGGGDDNDNGANDDGRHSSSGRAASAGGDDGSSSPLSCTGDFASYVGDGACDGFLNTEECGWDGGDCCLEGNCSECIDPDALAALPCSSERLGEEEEEEEEEEAAVGASSLSSSVSSEAPEEEEEEEGASTPSSPGSSDQKGEEEEGPAAVSTSSSSSSTSGSPLPSPPPAAWPSHLKGSRDSNKEDTATMIVVGLGVACLAASGVAFLGVSYSRLAQKEKEALAAERSAHGGGRDGGARTAQSTPTVSAAGFRGAEP